MLDVDIMLIEAMGIWGFSAKYIQEKLKARGSDYSTGTIYKYLRRAEISLRDYRNGKSEQAKAVFRKEIAVSLPTVKVSATKRRRTA